ncbi:hypothetical protein [Streptomyces sp. NPDC091268]|uniref:hypothetical protein n=1 Tax=Streptomyces sp. NPDC091268 TaxID=3365979 RepID=UPI0038112412
MDKALQRAVELTLTAAQGVTAYSGVHPWNYGWCNETYRRSNAAAVSSPSGAAQMSAEAVGRLEELHKLLASNAKVRDRWDLEELWGVLATLVAAVSASENPPSSAERYIGHVMQAGSTLVVFPVANLRWDGEPLRVTRKSVIGVLNEEFCAAIQDLGQQSETTANHISKYVRNLGHKFPCVGFATIVRGQKKLAQEQARRSFRLVVDVALMLATEKDRRNLWSMRGSHNRPGIRGLSMDRAATEAGLRASGFDSELFSRPLLIDDNGPSSTVSWFSADPLPLESLFEDEQLHEAVRLCLSDEAPVLKRLAVAARWYAESYWSESNDDAALAAGVALDALIGSTSALPGRSMRERYALLEADPTERSARAIEHAEIYTARSLVAHGGTSQKVDDVAFIRAMQDSVTWAAWRLIAMHRDLQVANNKDLEAVLDGLRWGTHKWQ